MLFYIIAYVVLTGAAIYYAEDESIFSTKNVSEFVIRIFFLLTVGWLFALCGIVGGALLWFAFTFGEQTIGVDFDPQERLFVIPWAAKKVWGFKDKLFFKIKKDEEPCTNDSQTEPR